MVELEVTVAVEGQHRDPLALVDSQFGAQGVGETQHPVTVLVPGAVVVAVVKPDSLRIALERGKQLAVVDELFHERTIPPPRSWCVRRHTLVHLGHAMM